MNDLIVRDADVPLSPWACGRDDGGLVSAARTGNGVEAGETVRVIERGRE